MKINLLAMLLLLFTNCFSQVLLNQDEVAEIKKNKWLLVSTQEKHSSTTFSNGKTNGTSRSISINFRIGEDGILQNIGKRGKNLKSVIQNDAEALAELTKAYNHLSKKRLYNTLEFVCYAGIIGAAIPLFIGLDNYEDEGINGLIVGGGIGVVASFGGILGFKHLTDKEMDKWRECIFNSIDIYNKNLITKK